MANTETQTVAQHEPRRRRKVNWAQNWVLIGAMASGGYLVIILATFLGAYYFKFIPSSAIVFIADTVWPFVCLGYIITQVIPMIVRYQTQGWDVGLDQITTIVALIGSVVVLAVAVFEVITIDAAGWKMFLENVLTHVIDVLLLLAGNKMIAAARGAEERNIR